MRVFLDGFHLVKKYRILEILQIGFLGTFGFISNNILDINSRAIWFLICFHFHVYGAYLLNDYYDWEVDQKNSRKSIGQKPGTGKLVFITLLFAFSILGVLNVSYTHALLFIIFNLISIIYSAPPLRLKRHRPFPFLLHFIMGFFYYLSGALTIGLGSVGQQQFLFGALTSSFVLASASLFNELLDKEADLRAGFKTLAHQLSFNKTKKVIFICHFFCLFFLVLLSHNQNLLISVATGSFVLLLYNIVYWLYFTESSLSKFRLCYRLLFSLIFFVYIIEKVMHDIYL